MSYNEKQRQYNDKYDAENMVAYTVKYQRSIYELVEKAMNESGMNRNKWTTTAIMEKLERDGYFSEWLQCDWLCTGSEQRIMDVVLNTMLYSVDNFMLYCG